MRMKPWNKGNVKIGLPNFIMGNFSLKFAQQSSCPVEIDATHIKAIIELDDPCRKAQYIAYIHWKIN